MSDSAQNTGDGETNQDTGSVNDPSGGGNPQADELARTEERRRALQSKLDQATARIKELEAKDTPTPPPAAQPVDVNQAIRAALSRDRAMTAALEAAKAQYPLAGSVNPDAFDTPEALADAMAEAHRRNEAAATALREQVEAKVREEYQAKFGPLPASPAGDSTTTTGKLTAEQLAKMPMSEFSKLDPELIKRIRRGEE